VTSHPGDIKWVPAYWEEGSKNVVDPTGCGNAFLGGLGAALYEGKTLDDGEFGTRG
jgi:sugar/nucleoside kinase (ribokinase family)